MHVCGRTPCTLRRVHVSILAHTHHHSGNLEHTPKMDKRLTKDAIETMLVAPKATLQVRMINTNGWRKMTRAQSTRACNLQISQSDTRSISEHAQQNRTEQNRTEQNRTETFLKSRIRDLDRTLCKHLRVRARTSGCDPRTMLSAVVLRSVRKIKPTSLVVKPICS